MLRETSWGVGAMLLAAFVAWTSPGCGPSGPPATSSPVTSADSEAGRKAIADDERFLKQRQEQEARARRRVKGLPAEG